MNEKLSDLYDNVDNAMADLARAQRKFLNAAGWEYSCSHPDCQWRWSKTINGRNYSFGAEEAIQMQVGLTQ